MIPGRRFFQRFEEHVSTGRCEQINIIKHKKEGAGMRTLKPDSLQNRLYQITCITVLWIYPEHAMMLALCYAAADAAGGAPIICAPERLQECFCLLCKMCTWAYPQLCWHKRYVLCAHAMRSGKRRRSSWYTLASTASGDCVPSTTKTSLRL